MAIVKSDQWERALQHLTHSKGYTNKWTTPIRELIKKMPRKS